MGEHATLHLQTMGGLCSRFRAVVGASAYCDVTGKNLIVHWMPFDHTEKLGNVPFPVRMSELWDHPYEECNNTTGKFPQNKEALNEPGDVRLRECHLLPFVPYMRQPIRHYLDRFRLTESVFDMVRPFIIGMTGPTVGVIIRWNDRNHPKDTPDMFVDRMKQITKVYSAVRFYLATDCIEVDQIIYKAFPGRVTALKHGTDYKYDHTGIMRSLADLHITAACDWVIGTRRSSYAQMAAFMRGGERAGPIASHGSVRGGRYEATDNPAPEGEMLRALGE